MALVTFRKLASIYVALVAALTMGNCIADQTNRKVARDDADELAAVIDLRLTDFWQKNQVEPAPRADDPEFLRRTYLNIAGRIPSVNEALEFLDNSCPDKRRDLIEQLLESPGYLSNFTAFWRDVIIPEVISNNVVNRLNGDITDFEIWLRDRLENNQGLDRIAREVISGNNEIPSEGTTSAFLRLKESKPENLAAGTSRAFLGLRLECAQCHNHPFAKWHREDFWKLAAFYASAQPQTSNGRKIKISETDQEVTAAFLDGGEPDFKVKANARVVLASWITTRENPYFAKAAVNRLWAHFFGIGFVDPVDDFDARNPPSHPELLEDLAKAFVSHRFDQRFLIRAITRSNAYQLTSRRTHRSQENPQVFARVSVKGLTSDQLFDSLIWATGNAEPQSELRNINRIDQQREKFREFFGQQASAPGEVQTSIPQALLMLNGVYVDNATSPDRGRTLSAIIESPFFNNEQRLEVLFIAALARPPRASEVATLLTYVEDTSVGHDWKQGLGDVYWALLNSSEFLLNH